MIQFWLWVAYILVSLALVLTLAYWQRTRAWRWRLWPPLWLLLVWPQPREPGAVELVPHWVSQLATLWSQKPVAFPWLLLPLLAGAIALGLWLDRRRASKLTAATPDTPTQP